MGKARVLQYDREGDSIFQVLFHRRLPASVELSGTPDVELQQRTATDPEVWADISSQVAITAVTIVDAVDDDGVTVLGTNQAVQFQIGIDADTDPEHEGVYRIMVRADRSDAGDIVGKPDIDIMP